MFTLPVGSFPKKEMEKYQVRLNRTICKIFAGIVKELLISEKKNLSPYKVKASDIDDDKRSQRKTLEILRSAGALPPSQSEKREGYYSYTTYYDYEDLFKEYSESYAEAFEFPEVPNKIRDFLQSDSLKHFSTNKESLDTYGYKGFNELYSKNKIYLYYHQDLYHFIKDTKLQFYPKAMLESRTKAVLKALMRMYCEEDMLSYLKRKFDLDLTGQEQSRDEYDTSFKVNLRNFSRYPTTFSEHCFETASKSYVKEYSANVAKINFEYNRLKALKDKLDSTGGCSAVLEGYIKESIDNLVSKAPTLINGDDDDKDALMYILDHRELIDYSYLYK